MRASAAGDLKARLDSLYEQFNLEHVVSDPIWRVRKYSQPEDLEIVGFCAAALAFGRVQSVLQSIDGLLAVMGASPAAYVRGFDPGRDRAGLEHLVHRWTRGADIAALVWVLRQMLEAHGSIEAFFARGLDPAAEDVQAALDSFSTRACALDVRAVYGRTTPRPGVAYFFSRPTSPPQRAGLRASGAPGSPPQRAGLRASGAPGSGGACKRLNLFLRWMVRKDAVDLGVWTRVRPAQLVVPLDTHVIRVGRCLGLTRYTSPGWRMAADITRSLRAIDPLDPVKYDFSLCHLGMMNACGFHKPQRDTQCPLRGACHPADLKNTKNTKQEK